MNNNFARHGDLSFHPLEELPKNLKSVEIKGNFVLAYGEHTGHKHQLLIEEKDQVEIFQDSEGRYVMKVNKPTKLSHEEHAVITLKKGIYIQKIEQEYDPFLRTIQQVKD